LPTDSQISNQHHDREQLSRARQAAEALFRPNRAPASQPNSASASPAAQASPGAQQEVKPVRTPRIFSTPQAKQPEEPPVALAPPPRAPAKKRSPKLAAADHVRIRTLADYGMTAEQVAEHFGVAVDIVERSLAATPAKG
jgi:soluble lytic murein transglycosylase-like protein